METIETYYWDVITMGMILVSVAIFGLYLGTQPFEWEPRAPILGYTIIISSFLLMAGGFMIFFIGLKV